jgi:S1-C subfamily serine protease
MDASVALLHRVARSTVTVAAHIPSDHPSTSILGSSRFGSGTTVSDDGLILTVNYIVLGANEMSVVDVDGQRYDAFLVAQDFASGVALLRTESEVIDEILPGDSLGVDQGDDIFMVASAGSNDRRSATGIVASLEPFDAYWEYRLERAIWTTCANPGLGGGPVCNGRGELIGVVSLNLGTIGRATLVIPAENYYAYATELVTHGRRMSRRPRAWLGMFCYAVADRTIVAGVVPGSPGEHSGLEVGDVIVRIDGHRVIERSKLYERIWTHGPGDVVELDIYRDGKLLTFPIHSVDVEAFFAS